MNHWTTQEAAIPRCFSNRQSKRFFNIHGKHLFWSLVLKKVAGQKACNFIKKKSTQVFSCEYCRIFKNNFFITQLRWLVLTVLLQYGKVSWCVFSLNLHPHMLSKRYTNYYLLSCNKEFFSLLELIDNMLSILEYVLEKTLVAFDFDKYKHKVLHQ